MKLFPVNILLLFYSKVSDENHGIGMDLAQIVRHLLSPQRLLYVVPVGDLLVTFTSI